MLQQRTITYSLPIAALKSLLMEFINNPSAITPDIELITIKEDAVIKGIFTRTVKMKQSSISIKERITTISLKDSFSVNINMLDNFTYKGQTKYTISSVSEDTTNFTISLNWDSNGTGNQALDSSFLDSMIDLHFNIFNTYLGLV